MSNVSTLADRTCDGCSVCCVALTIEDLELQKVQGKRCVNALPHNRCGIYDTRPQTCRTFTCGWRQLPWVNASLQPERSRVLVRLSDGKAFQTGAAAVSVTVTLLDRSAMAAEGLAETLAAGVSAGAPIYLEVAGRPGYSYGRVQINDHILPAVIRRDKAELLRRLEEVFEAGVSGPSRRITLQKPRSKPGLLR